MEFIKKKKLPTILPKMTPNLSIFSNWLEFVYYFFQRDGLWSHLWFQKIREDGKNNGALQMFEGLINRFQCQRLWILDKYHNCSMKVIRDNLIYSYDKLFLQLHINVTIVAFWHCVTINFLLCPLPIKKLSIHLKKTAFANADLHIPKKWIGVL